MRFNSSSTLVNVLNGKRYCIVSYNASLGPAHGFKESYILMEIDTGLQIQVVGNAIAEYEDEEVLPQGWSPPAIKSGLSDDLMDALRYVTFDDTHIKLHKMLIKPEGCDHDWVTWTGLHGTVTDCSKCKAKQ